MINNWILLGPANAKKTEIVISALIDNPIIRTKPFVLMCETDTGCAVELAIKHKIEIHIVDDIKLKSPKVIEMLKSLQADVLISCGWSYKIPVEHNIYFKYPIINCHGSVLPDYKGKRAYLHQWANIEGFYGATIHTISDKFDQGEIIIQGKQKLFLKENLIMIHRRLSELTAQLIPQALLMIDYNLPTQNNYMKKNSQSRYFYNIKKRKLVLHRLINRFAYYFNLKKWSTPHKM
ncbi:formyltransferase family protein [Gelidibacter gilvus]|uniref:phosphoribosylglycinamide formyltransferase 1 n=1 Tax=Gelidibacter gilvus TaxID=59602 RepID=A0A4Q0XER3_9FLAO|nr:formyltransferase family protein [Gelidibacter gilvus]RXJ46048.1 hypothetical protein ESZ48_13215 [Gelidibacter gilvus]